MAKSTNKDPRKIINDLVQKEYKKFYDRADEGLKEKLQDITMFAIRGRLPTDPYPSCHVYFDKTDHDQRGLPQKQSVDTHKLDLSFYTKNYETIWNTHQSIKEIIVGNNKATQTKQLSNLGLEIMNVIKTEWYQIYEGKERVTYYFVMEVDVKFQESYHS